MKQHQNSVTDQYVVVGNPVAHSLSPRIHQLFAAQAGIEIDYGKVEVERGGFAGFVDEFVQRGGKGLNVTVPFKADACAYVSRLDELAKAAGAVNTIHLHNGTSIGYNTDGIGLLADLRERHQQQLQGAHVMILGAGGATRGVMAPLLSCAPARLSIVNRTVAKAQELAAQFAPEYPHTAVAACGYDEVKVPADVIINATSSALSGAAVPLAGKWVHDAFCYDMSYGANAGFMRWAAAEGAADSVDGLGMLVEQAAAAFKIWRNFTPQTEPVYQALRKVTG